MKNTKTNATLRRVFPLLTLAPMLALVALYETSKAKAEDAPAPSASQAASASVSASASASAGAKGPFYVLGKDIPQERTKKPTKEEWEADADFVQLNRTNLRDCEVFRVREWLRITCKNAISVSLVAGSKKDVEMQIRGNSPFDDDDPFRAVLTLPLVRGQSQIFSLLDIDFGYDSAAFGDYATISVNWREGQENPVISALAAD